MIRLKLSQGVWPASFCPHLEALPSEGYTWFNTLQYSTLEFEPGENTAYTNIGYILLGAIIEKESGQWHGDEPEGKGTYF